jgi:hypothetical protein
MIGKVLTGDYVVVWDDSQQNRDEARKLMRRNGCKSIGFRLLPPTGINPITGEPLPDRLQVHGYLSRAGEEAL